jgi:hypothetical protein
VLLLPGFGQPPNGRRRQAWCFRPEQRGQRLGELAGGDALQVEPGQQFLDVARPAEIGRQDRRGEPDRLGIRRTAVADLRAAHLDRPDPGLDPPLGCMSVTHQAAPALSVDEPGMGGEERLDLSFNRLHQHPPGAIAQHCQQRVVGDAHSWPRQGDHAILLHGVSSRVT